jgi:hypothetical protein
MAVVHGLPQEPQVESRMTAFNHQQRAGRRKRPKKRKRVGRGRFGTAEALRMHRELQLQRANATGNGSYIAARRAKLERAA